MTQKLCWICHSPANSAEHMVKKSDLRSVFGQVTQRRPLIKDSETHKNILIPGANSRLIKFKPSLCSICNNTRSQPHDRAWERLSGDLRSRRPLLKAGDRIPMKEVFPGSVKESLESVHLYFLKLFGCYAVEYGIPLPLAHFGLCILNKVPYPHVYITFVSMASVSSGEDVVVGDITTITNDKQVVAASWYYCVGAIGIHIEYSLPGHPRLQAKRGWHPESINTYIRMQ